MIYGYTSDYVIFKEDMYYLVPIMDELPQKVIRYKSIEGFEGFCPYIKKNPPKYLVEYAKYLRKQLSKAEIQEF